MPSNCASVTSPICLRVNPITGRLAICYALCPILGAKIHYLNAGLRIHVIMIRIQIFTPAPPPSNVIPEYAHDAYLSQLRGRYTSEIAGLHLVHSVQVVLYSFLNVDIFYVHSLRIRICYTVMKVPLNF